MGKFISWYILHSLTVYSNKCSVFYCLFEVEGNYLKIDGHRSR